MFAACVAARSRVRAEVTLQRAPPQPRPFHGTTRRSTKRIRRSKIPNQVTISGR
jgi:hypothetical protein